MRCHNATGHTQWPPPKAATHVFLHVPKTGGGSAEIFFDCCPRVHVAFGLHALTLGSVVATGRIPVLGLRDPADRAISEYQWGAQDRGRAGARTVTFDGSRAARGAGGGTQRVGEFLRSLGLGKYAGKFQKEEIDVVALRRVTDKDLQTMGVPLGPRKKILAAKGSV